MSSPYLRFEDGRIQLGSKNLMVSSANLSISPSLNEERVYGDYEFNLAGSKTQFIKYSPSQMLQGKLDINCLLYTSDAADE